MGKWEREHERKTKIRQYRNKVTNLSISEKFRNPNKTAIFWSWIGVLVGLLAFSFLVMKPKEFMDICDSVVPFMFCELYRIVLIKVSCILFVCCSLNIRKNEKEFKEKIEEKVKQYTDSLTE